jgi:hypothetical protein
LDQFINVKEKYYIEIYNRVYHNRSSINDP